MTGPESFAVVGTGAIGGVLAHHLATGGHPVRLVDADPEHVAALRAGGLRLVGAGGEPVARHRLAVSTPDEDVPFGPAEHVLLATKSQHVATAAGWLARRLGTAAVVVLCQNGDSTPSARGLPASRVVPALVNFAADVVAPGVVRVGGPGQMTIGYDAASGGATARRIAAALGDPGAVGPGRGPSVSAVPDVLPLIWGKSGIAAIFTATAVVDADLPDVVDDHRELMAAVAAEVYAVARAKGITPAPVDGVDPAALTSSDPQVRSGAFDRLVAFTRGMTGKPRSGVFRDLAVRRRPTEARPSLDRIAAEGAERGVATPLLQVLAAIVGDLERGRRSFGVHNLADLGAATPLDEPAVAGTTARPASQERTRT